MAGKMTKIIEGINLIELGDKALLAIGGQHPIHIHWNEESKAMFENLDVADPIELLEMLTRLSVKKIIHGVGAAV